MTTPKIDFKGIKNWTIDNFFGSKLGILLTLFSALFIVYLISSIVSFLSSAEWEVVAINKRLLLLGRLPEEDTWRAWPILWLFCLFSVLLLVLGLILKKENCSYYYWHF